METTVAIILAGGSKPLITIGKRYMVDFVVEALQKLPYLQRIIIAGSPEALKKKYAEQSPQIELVNSGETTIESFMQAFRLVPEDAQQILIATGDIPLLTPEAVNHFVESCRKLEGALFYPIVSKEVNEQKYPGVKRTYVHLREGVFTGGNLFLIKPQIVEQCVEEAKELVRLRKKPLALVSHLGWKLLWNYVWGRLSLKEAEKGVSRLLGGVNGVAVISPYPEIGVDVDKPSDLALAKEILTDISKK